MKTKSAGIPQRKYRQIFLKKSEKFFIFPIDTLLKL